MTLTYTNLTATTLKHYEKQLVDNIFKAYPLLEKLLSKGQVKEFEGGEKIFIPLEYGTNTNVSFISKTGTIDTNAQELFTAAEDQWRILAGTIDFNDLDNVLNRGENQIVDLMKSKIKNLEKSLRKKLAEALHANQADEAINGLPDIVASSGTLHGISPNDFAGWVAGYANNTTKALSIIDMTTGYNTCSDGADRVDLIDMAQTLFEKYESLVAPQLRFSDNRTADAGFENLRFKGAVCVLDKDCTSDRVYFLNTDYLYLTVVKDRQFHAFPAVSSTNSIIDVVKVVWYGNLMTSNRRMQGMLDGRTA